MLPGQSYPGDGNHKIGLNQMQPIFCSVFQKMSVFSHSYHTFCSDKLSKSCAVSNLSLLFGLKRILSFAAWDIICSLACSFVLISITIDVRIDISTIIMILLVFALLEWLDFVLLRLSLPFAKALKHQCPIGNAIFNINSVFFFLFVLWMKMMHVHWRLWSFIIQVEHEHVHILYKQIIDYFLFFYFLSR